MELETILEEFYSTKSQERRRELHEWLLDAKQSPEIWRKLVSLLAVNRPQFVHYFAANTLYEKITNKWEECLKEGEVRKKRHVVMSGLG